MWTSAVFFSNFIFLIQEKIRENVVCQQEIYINQWDKTDTVWKIVKIGEKARKKEKNCENSAYQWFKTC